MGVGLPPTVQCPVERRSICKFESGKMSLNSNTILYLYIHTVLSTSAGRSLDIQGSKFISSCEQHWYWLDCLYAQADLSMVECTCSKLYFLMSLLIVGTLLYMAVHIMDKEVDKLLWMSYVALVMKAPSKTADQTLGSPMTAAIVKTSELIATEIVCHSLPDNFAQCNMSQGMTKPRIRLVRLVQPS